MSKAEVLSRIEETGIVPVVRAASSNSAVLLINALQEGGITVVEVTMTVPDALQIIEDLAKQNANLVVGAGTVLNPETAYAAILAGARFIVSPSLNVKTIEMCQQHSIAVMPGALTPTEVVTAWEAGADVVKVFPVSAVGGASYIRTLAAPLPDIKFMPSGGIKLENVGDYIAAGVMSVGVGGELVNTKHLEDGKPFEISNLAAKYLATVRASRKRNDRIERLL